MCEITRILNRIDDGDAHSAEQLLPLVYDELRKLAAVRLASEKPGQTLQPTALVHEVWMKLAGDPDARSWNSRGHFFGAAAECIRRILIDQARRKNAARHGGEFKRLDFNDVEHVAESRSSELLALSEAIHRLEAEDARKAELVKLRYFAGCSHQEAARLLDISRATADRWWNYSKSFLHVEVKRIQES